MFRVLNLSATPSALGLLPLIGIIFESVDWLFDNIGLNGILLPGVLYTNL